MLNANPAALFDRINPARIPPGKPLLQVVVDTEEEFNWAAPFDRASTAVTAIDGQNLAQAIFAPYGLRPTYVIDYPVATTASSVAVLKALRDAGQCQIGAHLHPWVTPPHDEAVNEVNSYACNLPPALERAKLVALTNAIAANFGFRPTMFKAGRYGLGRQTVESLQALGYRIDLSALVHSDLRPGHGPDFRGTPDRPFWFGDGLFEVPLTRGFAGALAGQGPWLYDLATTGIGQRLRLPGILARTGLLERITLTPEGVDFADQRRLVLAMLKQGHRVFSLTYHSPSLVAGHTPYVRDASDLTRFLDQLKRITAFFFEELGATATTAEDLMALAGAP